jgi:hypothetical protein
MAVAALCRECYDRRHNACHLFGQRPGAAILVVGKSKKGL